jgi:hypothetical protein
MAPVSQELEPPGNPARFTSRRRPRADQGLERGVLGAGVERSMILPRSMVCAGGIKSSQFRLELNTC